MGGRFCSSTVELTALDTEEPGRIKGFKTGQSYGPVCVVLLPAALPIPVSDTSCGGEWPRPPTEGGSLSLGAVVPVTFISSYASELVAPGEEQQLLACAPSGGICGCQLLQRR